MATKAFKLCSHPHCGELTNGRYCAEHQDLEDQRIRDKQLKYDRHRGSSRERGYDKQWEKVRRIKLSMNPLCEMCEKQGEVVPADMVHHKKAIKDGGAVYDLENLMSLCNPHHEEVEAPGRFGRKKE